MSARLHTASAPGTGATAGDGRAIRGPGSVDGTRFATLDGLRGVAALFVVVYHALSPFGANKAVVPHAQLAVDFFFALSGFVIAAAYEARLRSAMGAVDFLVRRWIRLFPMLLAGLALGWAAQLLKPDAGRVPEIAIAFAFNVAMLPDLSRWATVTGSLWPLNVALWSLGVEAVLNVTYAVWWHRASSAVLGLCGLGGAVALAWLAWRHAGISGGHAARTLADGVVRGIFPFVAGVLLLRCRRRFRLPAAAPATALAVMLAAVFVTQSGDHNALFEIVAVVGVLPCIVYLGAGASSGAFTAIASGWLGRLSYPLYAVHYPIVQLGSVLARRWHVQDGGLLGLLVCAELAIAVPLSLLLARFYEEPVRRWMTARLGPSRAYEPVTPNGPFAPSTARAGLSRLTRASATVVKVTADNDSRE